MNIIIRNYVLVFIKNIDIFTPNLIYRISYWILLMVLFNLGIIIWIDPIIEKYEFYFSFLFLSAHGMQEMNLLVEADQPGNQLDDYITRLNAILSQKAAGILQLQTRLAHFQKRLKEHNVLVSSTTGYWYKFKTDSLVRMFYFGDRNHAFLWFRWRLCETWPSY